MQKRILVVTASRVLCDTQAARSWLYAQCVAAIEEAEPRPGLVVNGGAKSDRVATDVASRNNIDWREFRLDGWTYGPELSDVAQIYRWRHGGGPESNPLNRNARMIECVGAVSRERWSIEVLALVAPWAKTHGTDHTATLARKAGFKVTRLECPMELAGG